MEKDAFDIYLYAIHNKICFHFIPSFIHYLFTRRWAWAAVVGWNNNGFVEWWRMATEWILMLFLTDYCNL